MIKFYNVKIYCDAVKADFTQDFIICAAVIILLPCEPGVTVTMLFLRLLPVQPQTQTQTASGCLFMITSRITLRLHKPLPSYSECDNTKPQMLNTAQILLFKLKLQERILNMENMFRSL